MPHWLSSRSQITSNGGKDVEKGEPLFIVGGNLNSCSHQSGLNENGPYRLLCLNTWFPAVGTDCEGFESEPLLGRCVTTVGGLELSKGSMSFPVCSPLPLGGSKCELSAPAPAPYLPACLQPCSHARMVMDSYPFETVWPN